MRSGTPRDWLVQSVRQYNRENRVAVPVRHPLISCTRATKVLSPYVSRIVHERMTRFCGIHNDGKAAVVLGQPLWTSIVPPQHGTHTQPQLRKLFWLDYLLRRRGYTPQREEANGVLGGKQADSIRFAVVVKTPTRVTHLAK